LQSVLSISPSLREQAREVIRARIVAGELQAGEIYSAVTLAESLGVSQTPVREAMLDLATAGLVEPIRNRGFRVLTMSETDLDEISLLRQLLEVPAMELVIQRATDDELSTFDEPVEALERTAEEGDIGGFLVADRRFHLSLLELTGNGRLVRMVGQLRDQTRLMGLHDLATAGKLFASASEHRQLLDSIRARDVATAEEIMRRHLLHTRGIWAGHAEESRAILSEQTSRTDY
jgi:DNA-binding GntR family transcriptional regulator